MSEIIDADALQAEWEEYIRAPCRPCRDIIVAQERPYADADFEVYEE
ncbi:MAG TPA: hypothetical protein O0X42_01020 [Methanocorpusculum sp.]|nr:hypothetical protein [Methanocorpusculum sp.]